MPDRIGEVWELDAVSWRGARVYVCLGLTYSKYQPNERHYLLLPMQGVPEPIERARYLFDDPPKPSPGIEKWTRLA